MNFSECMNEIINLLSDAKKKIILELKKEISSNEMFSALKIEENSRSGHGIETSLNDRRMYFWISTVFDNREYVMDLFKSEIDSNSGNCHSQLGRIQFVKGFVANGKSCSSPNEVISRSKDSTTIVFHSGKWIEPHLYMEENINKSFGNKKWLTVDDVLENKIDVNVLVKAFLRFIEEDCQLNRNSN